MCSTRVSEYFCFFYCWFYRESISLLDSFFPKQQLKALGSLRFRVELERVPGFRGLLLFISWGLRQMDANCVETLRMSEGTGHAF